MVVHTIEVPSITSDGYGASYFSHREFELRGDQHRCLSEQIPALNFRLRTSPVGYVSEFHVAGDPTLLIILRGAFVVRLRSGDERVYSAGEMFVAEDFIAREVAQDDEVHGHQGLVTGSLALEALHLKLEKRLL